MNPLVEEKWLSAKHALQNAISGVEIVECLIPDWEPVDLAMGLRWLQSSIYEGFRVKFTTEHTPKGMRIRFEISDVEE